MPATGLAGAVAYAALLLLGVQARQPRRQHRFGGYGGSYLGLVLLAAVFAAIGIFASAITRDQIIAFLVAVVGCFLVYSGFDSLASVFEGTPAYYISQLGIAAHYRDISKGLVDSRDLLYFFSLIAGLLLATRVVLQSRNW